MNQSYREARDALVRAIRLLDAPDSFEQFNALVVEYGTRFGSDVFLVLLGDLLDTAEGRLKINTAYAVLSTDRRSVPQKRAVETLENALADGPMDDRLLATWFLLYTSGITERAIEALTDLGNSLTEADPRRLWVAGAIYRAAVPDGSYEELRYEVMWQLLGALRQKHDPNRVLIAAIAMREEQLHLKTVCSSLMDAYEYAKGQDRVAIIGHLGKIGRSESSVVKKLLSIVTSDKESDPVRLAAIHSLVYATISRSEIDKTLARAMQDENPTIVLQATAVLHRRCGGFPPTAVKLLLSYLSHPIPGFRSMAALCLADDPPGLNQAIPVLIQRLEEEENDEIAGAVIAAIGQSGAVAIQPIANAIASASHHRLVRYQGALMEASREDPALVARLIAMEDGVVGSAAAWVLGTMGPVAAPAVPVLEELLTSSNPDCVQNALVALQSIGPAAASCAESLVELLSHEVEEIRIWSEMILLRIGPVIVPSLVSWRNSHLDVGALERIIEKLSPLPMTDAAEWGVDGIRNENDLELFHHMAQLLTEHGSLSLRALAVKLQELQETRRVRSDLPCSDRQIGLVINRLEKEWSNHTGQLIRLVDRGRKRKGGLTTDGVRYARLVGEYLERRRATRDSSR